MPHDPVRVAEVRSWCIRAAADLRSGPHQLSARPPDTADAVFHAQQAAEKALKAFLSWHDVPFRKTHDLADLGRACSEIDSTLAALLKEAASLTQYAWKFRYPGDWIDPTVEEAESAIVLSRSVVEAVMSRLPAELHL